MMQPFAAFPRHPLLLVGSSLGDESDAVVRAAVALARAAGGRVHAVHALEPPPRIVPGGGLGFGLLAAGRADEIGARLREQLRRAGARAEEVNGVEVHSGGAPDVLAQAAERVGAAAVIVGGAAANALPMQRLGSTPMRLLREGRWPVLVVKGELRVPPRTVLAPVDLSLLAGDSLRCGLALLAAAGGEPAPRLVAIHVSDRTGEDRVAAAELAQFVGEGTAGWSGAVETIARRGDPRAEILAAAEARLPDLVLLGTHGRSGWQRLRLGSVAEAVVRDAPVSVLVVPPMASLAGALAEAVLAETAGVPV
jgi:nucleotide-binding universal stress UspA family protein